MIKRLEHYEGFRCSDAQMIRVNSKGMFFLCQSNKGVKTTSVVHLKNRQKMVEYSGKYRSKWPEHWIYYAVTSGVISLFINRLQVGVEKVSSFLTKMALFLDATKMPVRWELDSMQALSKFYLRRYDERKK